ncbi:D-erythrose-4-phosphate dehydrogenase [Streptomyces microflavus]
MDAGAPAPLRVTFPAPYTVPASRRSPRTGGGEAARRRHSGAGVHDPRETAVRGEGVRGAAGAGDRWRRAVVSRRPRARSPGSGPTSSSYPDTGSRTARIRPRAVVDALTGAHRRGARLAAISTVRRPRRHGSARRQRATTHWHYTGRSRRGSARPDRRERPVCRRGERADSAAPPRASICACTSCAAIRGGCVAPCRQASAGGPYRSGGQATGRAACPSRWARFAATRVACAGSVRHSRSTHWPAGRGLAPAVPRRFVDETGYTPMQWVMRAPALDVARELLELSHGASSRSPPTSAWAPGRICGCTSSGSSAPRRASTGGPSPGASRSRRRGPAALGPPSGTVRPSPWPGQILAPWRSRRCHRHTPRANLVVNRKGHHSLASPSTHSAARRRLRALLERESDLEVVAVNDLTEPQLARLLAFDSTAGRLGRPVKADGDTLVVDGRRITVLAEREPAPLPWPSSASTSCWKRPAASPRPRPPAPTSTRAPRRCSRHTGVRRRRHARVRRQHRRVRPNGAHHRLERLVHDPRAGPAGEGARRSRRYRARLHDDPYTQEQNLQDGPHRDARRAARRGQHRPTTTGAAKAIGLGAEPRRQARAT